MLLGATGPSIGFPVSLFFASVVAGAVMIAFMGPACVVVVVSGCDRTPKGSSDGLGRSGELCSVAIAAGVEVVSLECKGREEGEEEGGEDDDDDDDEEEE